MSYKKHAMRLSMISKSAYSSLQSVHSFIQNYLTNHEKKWNLKPYDTLSVFIHVFNYICYKSYLEPEFFSVLTKNIKKKHFPQSLHFLFITNIPIPKAILDYLMQPVINEITTWNVPSKQEQDNSTLFFDQYLRTYNPDIAKELGIVYTPSEIVTFMVDGIDKILQHYFGVIDGLKNEKFPYKIIDPASGTMNFFNGLVSHISNSNMKLYSLSKKILTIELSDIAYLLGLYEVTRLVPLSEKHNILQGNTLTAEYFDKMKKFIEMGNKFDIPIIIGNPPYFLNTQNNSPWIKDLIEEYKINLHEKNLKILSDDYVKFIRVSQKLFQDNKTKGIVAFITNNNYLDGPVFLSMRKSLLRTFNNIFVVNLHGNFRKNETGNPFKIKVGVSIIFLVKFLKNKKFKPHLYYWDVKSPVVEEKYEELSQGFKKEQFIPIQITSDVFFIPRTYNLEEKFQKFDAINDIFLTSPKSGIMTGRDSLVSNPDKAALIENINLFFQQHTTELKKLGISANETKTWDPEDAFLRSSKNNAIKSIIRYHYRGFVQDYLVYDKYLVDGCRWGYLNTLSDTNPAICVTRSVRTKNFSHVLIVQDPPEKCFLGIKDSSYVFPLYKPKDLSKFNLVSPSSIKYTLDPPSLFYYIYAILHAPTYRSRYREQLKKHFPRIPFPSDKEISLKMVALGKELAMIHLKRNIASLDEFQVIRISKSTIKAFEYDKNNSTVLFKQSTYSLKISGITEEMWNFEIGSIRQIEYWLKSRQFVDPANTQKKRHIGLTRPISSEELTEFLELCTKIHHTLRLVPKIDHVYKQIDIS